MSPSPLNSYSFEAVRRILGGRPDLFNAAYYGRVHRDVAVANVDPLTHFIEFGDGEDRPASATFDTAYYRRANPDVAAAGVNALLHFILHGEAEGRWPNAGNRRFIAYFDPDAEDAGHITHRSSPCQSEPDVDVIIPTFGQRDKTLACIGSILSSRQRLSYELIVIDDAGPSPSLRDTLRDMANTGLFTLVENAQNIGFTGSANLAMAMHRSRDVVLLNSDTLVFNDWLDRLVEVGRAEPRIGTATAFSNNATICSYPDFNRDNSYRFEVPDADLDAMARETNAGAWVEIPTGVGCCMFVRRACLEEVGPFDQQAFPKGYGEDVDFCCRATKLGWRHVLAANVFIRHFGNASFGARKYDLTDNAEAMLRVRYPDFRREVESWVRRDPARELRARLDLARMARAAGGSGPCVAIIAAGLEGRCEAETARVRDALRTKGLAAHPIVLAPDGSGRAVLGGVETVEAGNLPDLDVHEHLASLVDMCRRLNVGSVLVDRTVSRSDTLLRQAWTLAAALAVPFDVALQDHSRLFRQAEDGCGTATPSASRPAEALAALPITCGTVAVRRCDQADVLANARFVLAANDTMANRLRTSCPGLNVIHAPDGLPPLVPGPGGS